jgi:threonine/homoserine efflux transporter RhtA
VLLVVVAAICQEVGAAFAVGLFAALGAIGAVCVRFLVAGSILCVAVRPRLRGLSGRAWFSAVAGWLILGQHLAVTAYVAIVLGRWPASGRCARRGTAWGAAIPG